MININVFVLVLKIQRLKDQKTASAYACVGESRFLK